MDGGMDGRTGFLQERAEVGASPSFGFLLCAWVPSSSGFLLCAWLPLVFRFAVGTKQNIGFVLVFCFAVGYQTEHWVCSGFLLCGWVPNRTLGLLWKRRGGEGDEGNRMKSRKLGVLLAFSTTESAWTVERTDRHIFYGRTGPDKRMRYAPGSH
jgi:hypothetical protein